MQSAETLADLTDNSGGRSGTSWQIDKRIPLALILAILLQSGGIVWWAKSLENRVELLERTSATTENFARFDEKMTNMKEAITDLKEEVRRLALHTKP